MKLRLVRPIDIRLSENGRLYVENPTGSPVDITTDELAYLSAIGRKAGGMWQLKMVNEERLRQFLDQGILQQDEAETDCGHAAWPVFLVGCHRSGTTLVRYLLDTHPNLACPPESKFIAGLQAFLDYPQVASALMYLGLSRSEIRLELRRIVETLLGGYAEKQGKPRWVDKTPNYYRLLPFIDEIFSGQVLYLLIVRHPLDCIDSLHSYYQAATKYHEDPEVARAVKRYGKDLYAWAEYWNEVNKRIYTFARLNPDRCHLFKYEDLAQEPHAALSQLFVFLGETLPDDLVQGAFSKKHTKGYQDQKIKFTQGIQPDSIGKWKDWPSSKTAALWQLVAETATQLGYQV